MNLEWINRNEHLNIPDDKKIMIKMFIESIDKNDFLEKLQKFLDEYYDYPLRMCPLEHLVLFYSNRLIFSICLRMYENINEIILDDTGQYNESYPYPLYPKDTQTRLVLFGLRKEYQPFKIDEDKIIEI